MYSMMWPIWNGPFENGSAVVMKRGREAVISSTAWHSADEAESMPEEE
jgi:hypothetical protein